MKTIFGKMKDKNREDRIRKTEASVIIDNLKIKDTFIANWQAHFQADFWANYRISGIFLENRKLSLRVPMICIETKQSRLNIKFQKIAAAAARSRNDLSFLLLSLILLIGFQTVAASDPIPAKKQDKPIALIGGTIHTVSGPVIENGMIVFDNGVIVAIGKEISIPPNADRVDVSGKHVYPGLINAASEIGLTEIEAVRATLDINESGKFNPNVRTESAINPESELIPTTRANGIAIAHVIPRGGVIAGRTSAILLDGWTNEEMTLAAPVGLYVNWPSMTISRSRVGPHAGVEQKKSNAKKLGALRMAFGDAGPTFAGKLCGRCSNGKYRCSSMRMTCSKSAPPCNSRATKTSALSSMEDAMPGS